MQDLATTQFLLTPGNKWPEGTCDKRKLETVHVWLSTGVAAKEWVRTLTDDELRRTPYWDAVIYQVCLNKGWACEICGKELYEPDGTPNGEAHRLSIDSYGREFSIHTLYQRAFAPMCKSCYQRVKKAFPEVFERDRKEIERLVKTYK